jgi:hypothetical protein
MRPSALRTSGRKTCVVRSAPKTFTSKSFRSSSSFTASIGPPSPTPALFTTPPSPSSPTRFETSSNAARI